MHPVPQEEAFTIGLKRSSLEAVLIHACPHCQAPGVYSADASIEKGWPGCYDPSRVQEPVGDTCPNCNKQRKPNKDLGELQASLPLWIWNSVLGVKRLIIGFRSLKRRIVGA